MPLPSPAVLRNRKITRIHAAWRNTGLDQPTYRNFLVKAAGKSSCKEMTLEELDAVIAALAPKPMPRPRRGISSDRRVRKVYAIWRHLGELGALRARTPAQREAALFTWCRAHYGVDAPEFIDKNADIYSALGTLEQWERRIQFGQQQMEKAAPPGERR